MTDTLAALRARIEAWRADGGARGESVRVALAEALARRAAAFEGEPRRVLEARLATLLDESGGAASRLDAAAPSRPSQAASLAALRDAIAQHPSRQDGSRAALAAAERGAAYPELAMLDELRELWARVGSDGQVRQSRQRVPDNAGPLNSDHLIHRALATMRAVSPGYLRHFLAHADALAWLERMPHRPVPPGPKGRRAGR